MIDGQFVLNIAGVDPIDTLSDVASSINETLQGFEGDVSGLIGPFGSGFGSVAEMLGKIANVEQLQLSLDAALDLSVSLNLSLAQPEIATELKTLYASFLAVFAEPDGFDIDVASTSISVVPYLELFLEANNTETPFDVVSETSKLANFSFDGTFDALIAVGIDGVPAQVVLRASSEELVSDSALHACESGRGSLLFPADPSSSGGRWGNRC